MLEDTQPAALDEAEGYMMMAGLLSHLLCGERSIDPTAAGTMMAMDLARRDWSPGMLRLASLDTSFFPRWVEPGGVIRAVHQQAAEATGLPVGIKSAVGDTGFWVDIATRMAAIGTSSRPPVATFTAPVMAQAASVFIVL